MSYDLALWVGQRPASDADAMRTYEATFGALDEADEVEPASAAIAELIDRLHRRWPPFDPDSPWAFAPLDEGADGDTLYVNLVLVSSDLVVRFIADTARALASSVSILKSRPSCESAACLCPNGWHQSVSVLRGGLTQRP